MYRKRTHPFIKIKKTGIKILNKILNICLIIFIIYTTINLRIKLSHLNSKNFHPFL